MSPVIAIGMMHNEEDVAPFVVRHMLTECDAVIVADHGSTDRTRKILDRIRDRRLTVLSLTGPFRQARHMNGLVLAVRRRAEWIVPFDADEWWTSPHGRIADVLRRSREEVAIATGYEMVPQPDDDPTDLNPFTRLRARRPLPTDWQKVAFRPGPRRLLSTGNHYLIGGPVGVPGLLEIAHVPYRSLEQLTRKVRHGARALDLAGEPATRGWHWRELGDKSDAELADYWRSWTAL